LSITGATIDHLISTTLVVAVILVFIGLANQTLQSATLYQSQRNLDARCSGLLDSMLYSPGVPSYWGIYSSAPTVFGLQDPVSSENQLSSFSLMRLGSGTQTVYYSKTGASYNNMTIGPGDSLLEPVTEIVNYTAASQLLGINGTYGFQLTLKPTVTVSVSMTQSSPSLSFSVNAKGTGAPLANGAVSYYLIVIGFQSAYPSYSLIPGTGTLDNLGSTPLNFPGVNGSSSFVLFAYAYLPGLAGMGYYKQVTDNSTYVAPIVSDVGTGQVVLAHSYDIDRQNSTVPLTYNATFISVGDDLAFVNNPMQNSYGTIDSGAGKPYGNLTIAYGNCGILVIAYEKSLGGPSTTGLSLMPWGIGPLAFPITFGDSPAGKEWVSTDLRQVVLGNVAYQAVLSLWSM
jgi:hypothetical protein